MAKLRIPGIILMAYAVIGAIFNLNILGFFLHWQISIPQPLAAVWAIFWNPLSLIAAAYTGDIWLIGGALNAVLSLVFALIWAGIIFVVGLVLAK